MLYQSVPEEGRLRGRAGLVEMDLSCLAFELLLQEWSGDRVDLSADVEAELASIAEQVESLQAEVSSRRSRKILS